MEKKVCEICGYARKPEDLIIHQIVPEEVATQAGISYPETVVLCINCRNEIQTWYDKKVLGVSYDESARRFVPKSPAQMVREYEAVYREFAAYKKRRRTKRGHFSAR